MPTAAMQHLMPYADILLAQAREYLGKQDNFAIILAHMACEIETEVALESLIQSGHDPVLADLLWKTVGVPMHLDAKRVYRIYSTLASDYPKGHTGHQLAPADWWARWKASLKVRNEIVHGKANAIANQAETAIEVSAAYVKRVREKTDAAVKLSKTQTGMRPTFGPTKT